VCSGRGWRGAVCGADAPGYRKAARALVSELCAHIHGCAQVEAAEELFEVLTHPAIAKRRAPILLACNKMDLETQVGGMDHEYHGYHETWVVFTALHRQAQRVRSCVCTCACMFCMETLSVFVCASAHVISDAPGHALRMRCAGFCYRDSGAAVHQHPACALGGRSIAHLVACTHCVALPKLVCPHLTLWPAHIVWLRLSLCALT